MGGRKMDLKKLETTETVIFKSFFCVLGHQICLSSYELSSTLLSLFRTYCPTLSWAEVLGRAATA